MKLKEIKKSTRFKAISLLEKVKGNISYFCFPGIDAAWGGTGHVASHSIPRVIDADLPIMQFFSGALYDLLGDYDAGFYFAGTMIFISGAMLFAIPVLQRKLERKKPTFDITSGKGEDEFVPDV